MKILRIDVPAAALCGALVAFSFSPPAQPADREAEAEANRIAHDHVLCRKYGYDEGTDEFAHCLGVLAQRRADATAEDARKRREASSNARALSSAESNACGTRNDVVMGGSRNDSNAHEGSVGTCSH